MGRASQPQKRAGRGYFMDERGVRLPSVTTILNATRPPEARESLARWRDRLGPQIADQVTIAASRRGTLTHTQLRNHLTGKPTPCPDLIRPYWDSLQPVLAQIQDVHLVEATVFHYDLGYAGKVDCVVNYDGRPCLLDWKTGDRPKGSWERLYDAPLQVAAYCGAVNHSLREIGLEVRSACVVVALPDQPAEVFCLSGEEMLSYWNQWEERLALFYRRRGGWGDR